MNKTERKVLDMMIKWIEGTKLEFNEEVDDAMWESIQNSQLTKRIPVTKWESPGRELHKEEPDDGT